MPPQLRPIGTDMCWNRVRDQEGQGIMKTQPQLLSQCGEEPGQTSNGGCRSCQSCRAPIGDKPEASAFDHSYHHHASIFCLVVICVGIVMKLPVIWGLGLLGIVVAVYRLRHAKARRNST